ncbi:MAG: peptide-methionine (R)-S-oxide reductase MsrB [Gammaproteobacteria bacterium]|nr:peptide-methionine (R)-S-oxide reductase MsrB [Gammaproteobacteria bacterium]
MNRRRFLDGLTAFGALGVTASWSGAAGAHDITALTQALQRDGGLERLDVSRDYWRQYLDELAWDVLFRERTERPFTSPLNDETRAGTYVCAACHLPLFLSSTKYDSGTGWPSFHTAIAEHVGTKRDFKLIIPRTEYHCLRCGGHQGHVFNDGPQPTGKRWCNNGVALRFVPSDEPLPELRG